MKITVKGGAGGLKKGFTFESGQVIFHTKLEVVSFKTQILYT